MDNIFHRQLAQHFLPSTCMFVYYQSCQMGDFAHICNSHISHLLAALQSKASRTRNFQGLIFKRTKGLKLVASEKKAGPVK